LWALQQSEVCGERRATQREGVQVMNLELVARGAAVARAADEGALSAIAPPHLVADGRRDVAAARRRHVYGGLLAGAAAPAVGVRQDRAEPLVQHLGQGVIPGTWGQPAQQVGGGGLRS
jgi:hypothetical protein